MNRFARVSERAAQLAGQPIVFALVVSLTLAWVVTGPISGFSNAWQLTINTASTIWTWWLVVLLQNSQNRSVRAIELKLDAILIATQDDEQALRAEELSDRELAQALEEYRRRSIRTAKDWADVEGDESRS